MHGFICTVSLQNSLPAFDYEWKKPFPFQGDMVNRQASGDNYLLEQFTSEKLIKEKHWIDTETFFFVIEGAILNFDMLKESYSAKNNAELLEKLYDADENFFKKFEGNFAGIFYHKKDCVWTAFNNHTGTKRLFYSLNENYLIVSTDLFTHSATLSKLNCTKNLDEEAAYLLLTCRMVFENMTLIKEVKQARAGEYVRFDFKALRTGHYFHLSEIEKNVHSKEQIIANLDEKFSRAIKLQHDIDLKHDFDHLTTLSGGLDSRMELICACREGYNRQKTINFTSDGYADQIISKQIAADMDIPLMQFSLTSEMLTTIDDIIAINDGLISYSGCSHIYSVLPKFDNARFGAIHTGIMGDTVMGSSVVKDASRIKKRLFSIDKNFPEQSAYIDNLISRYKNPEMCLIYNLIFFGESNGFVYFDTIGCTLSPFLDVEFLTYAYSVPDEKKYNRAMYIDWIKSRCPKAADFVWEAQGCKPTNNVLAQQWHRYKRAVIKRLPVNTMWKNDMAPDQMWYDNDSSVREIIDRYFYENIDYTGNSKVKETAKELYREKNFEVKTRCVTLAGASKLLFG